MKLKAPKKALLSALSRVGSVANAKSPLPIAACVLFDTRDDVLWLKATDTTITLEERVDAVTISEPGAVALPYRQVSAIVQAMPDGIITLTLRANNAAELAAGPRKLRVTGRDANEFPALDAFTPTSSADLDPSLLTRLMQRVSHAANSPDRPALEVLRMLARDGALSFAGTDGHRMALASAPWSGPDVGTLLIPNKAARSIVEISGTLDPKKAIVNLSTAANRGRFTTDSVVLDFALPSTTFPPVEAGILSEGHYGFVGAIDPVGLAGSVQAMLAVAEDRGNPSVEIESADGLLHVSITGTNSGGTDHIECGSPAKAKFKASARFLVEALRSCGEAPTKLLIGQPLDPVQLKTEDGFLAVIMPQR